MSSIIADTITGVTEDRLPEAASWLLKSCPDARVFLLYGEMGAGKTTLIKQVCRLLGVKDSMSSPTFSIVNEYRTGSGKPVYHFDFYRLKSQEEAMDLGYEEYFYSGSYCFAEWPEKIPDLLPDDAIQVRIDVAEGLRTITIGK